MTATSTPRLVTVFGGTGFIGRHVVRVLARRGYRVRVATRSTQRAYDLKPMGEVGQISLVRADIRNEHEVRAAVDGAVAVVNLVGLLRPASGVSLATAHVEGAANVARASKSAGVKHLVHMSAIGASPNSPSKYGRTKAEGEAAVSELFAGAFILRPSVVFGPGDGFFNKFASLIRASRAAFPLFGGGKTKFQPVYVGDVAEAVVRVIENPPSAKLFELGGPATYTLREVLEFVCKTIERPRAFWPFPLFALEFISGLVGWLPFSPITYDQARMLRTDNVVSAGSTGKAIASFADLGIQPTAFEAVVPSYLYIYRPTGQFSEGAKA